MKSRLLIIYLITILFYGATFQQVCAQNIKHKKIDHKYNTFLPLRYAAVFIPYIFSHTFPSSNGHKSYFPTEPAPAIFLNADSSTGEIYPPRYLNSQVTLPESGVFTYIVGAKVLSLFTVIDPEDFQDFRYRLIVDDKEEIVHWEAPKFHRHIPHTKFLSEKRRDSLQRLLDENRKLPYQNFIFLNALDFLNKKLTIQIYNIHYPNIIATGYIYNKPVPIPQIFDKAFFIDDKTNSKGLDTQSLRYVAFGVDDKRNGVAIDSLADLHLVIRKNDADMIYQVYVQDLSEKNSNALRVPVKWETLDPITQYYGYTSRFAVIPQSYFQSEGIYKITVVPELPSQGAEDIFKNKAVSVMLRILPPSTKTISLKQAGLYLGIFAAISALVFWRYKETQSKKLARETRQKEMAGVQLNAVRSQLNPHFVFNALAGIQNLMNKNETDTANRYLGKFARLTRNVLDSTHKELISIAEEKKLLEDYLQMEQLRFGFRYFIDTDKELDENNTEIPAMLFQPFIENAVKHGVCDKLEAGTIHVSFSREGNDLHLQITDNGPGFDTGRDYKGLGLRLSQDRIALLNTLYKEMPVTLKTLSGQGGTRVSIRLRNWL